MERKSQWQNWFSQGFMLTELLVVMAIMIILLTVVLANYHTGGRQFALQRSVSKLAQDIRRAQEMAMETSTYGGAVPKGGFGIYLDIGSSNLQYILFADLSDPPDNIYNSGEEIEILEFEGDVFIESCSPSPRVDITFVPPDPEVKINQSSASEANITLKIDERTRTITVNEFGLIEIN